MRTTERKDGATAVMIATTAAMIPTTAAKIAAKTLSMIWRTVASLLKTVERLLMIEGMKPWTSVGMPWRIVSLGAAIRHVMSAAARTHHPCLAPALVSSSWA